MEPTIAYRSGNTLGKEEDRESAQKLPRVGTTDNDLGPSAVSENAFGEGGSERVFQEPVEVECHGVTREEP